MQKSSFFNLNHKKPWYVKLVWSYLKIKRITIYDDMYKCYMVKFYKKFLGKLYYVGGYSYQSDAHFHARSIGD